MSNSQKQGPKLGLYRHYRGTEYRLISIATHSETGEKLAVYHPVGDSGLMWVRPLDLFMGRVLVNETEIERFAYTKKQYTPPPWRPKL